MKSRNPVAGNSHKYNIAKPFVPKKGKGSFKRKSQDPREINLEDPNSITE